MTNVPGLLLVIRTADCLPVLLVDEENRAVAAVHCGWRGTEKRILEKAVKAMGEAYGSKPAEHAGRARPLHRSRLLRSRTRSPQGLTCRPDFRRASLQRDASRDPGAQPRGKYLLDLRAANVWLLDSLGFKKRNIFNPGAVCTHCEPRLLSYRRHAADPRRMYNFIGLLPAPLADLQKQVCDSGFGIFPLAISCEEARECESDQGRGRSGLRGVAGVSIKR